MICNAQYFYMVDTNQVIETYTRDHQGIFLKKTLRDVPKVSAQYILTQGG